MICPLIKDECAEEKCAWFVWSNRDTPSCAMHMIGASISSVDMTLDKISDLLGGAPSSSDIKWMGIGLGDLFRDQFERIEVAIERLTART